MLNQEQIKKNHSSKWPVIWYIYNKNQKFYKGVMFLTSSVFSLFIIITSIVLEVDFFRLICEITDLYISIIPNLLGFNLGAYALLIGLTSSTFLPHLTKGIDKDVTFFQKASSVFAFCIALQALTLIFAFVIKQIVLLQELSDKAHIFLNNDIISLINVSIFFILNFIGIYSILLILMLVKNIFGLSQTANFFSGVENIKSTKNNKE